jgi:hypothetical protein
MKKLLFLLLFQFTVFSVTAISLTLRLNMSNETVAPEGIFVAGSFQGWNSSSSQMTEESPGVYAFTIDVVEGTYGYKFINGTLWESFSGDCLVDDGSGNFNRSVTVSANAVDLPAICFNSCSDCDPIINPTETNLITFLVNMSNQTVSDQGVHIAGNFQGWLPSSTVMESIGNGLYSITLELSEWSNLSYKFINGNDWPQQEVVPSTCGLPDGFGGYNRITETGTNDITIGPICFGECADCEVIVEPTFVTMLFQVDMSNETVSPQGVHVAGNFQGWNPNGTVMTDLGGGIYELTYQVEANSTVEFKFINGSNWTDQESLPAECGIDDGVGGFKRSIEVGDENLVFGPVCYGSCSECTTPVQVMLLLQVDMSNTPVAAEGLQVAGNFNNWDLTANPLSDSGNGIYQALIFVESDQTLNYKFVNGQDWTGAELVPIECGQDDGGGNLNRFVEVAQETLTLDPVCFSSCSACVLEPMVDVTFQVNMSNEIVEAGGVFIGGSFNDFTPALSPMTSIGSGIYTYTASVPTNSIVTYKFLNGVEWTGSEIVPFSCGVDDGFGGYNRSVTTDVTDFPIPVVCFSSCEDCQIFVDEMSENTMHIFPNPGENVITITGLNPNEPFIEIHSITGGLVMKIATSGRSNLTFDISSLAAGLYSVITSDGSNRIFSVAK